MNDEEDSNVKSIKSNEKSNDLVFFNVNPDFGEG